MIIGNSTSTTATTRTTSQASADKKEIDQDLNQFLKLLVTQLQNQDPLQPMDANQFTTQLVQFASVEQQIYQNANLEKLVSLQEGSHTGSLINYLGSMVEIEGSSMSLQGGSASASYTLDETAAQTTLKVLDASGKVVFSRSGETGAGTHTFTWDGRTTGGTQLADSTYTIAVDSRHIDGTSVDVTTHVLAQVTGIANDGDEPELIAGDQRIALSDVLSVSLPTMSATGNEE